MFSHRLAPSARAGSSHEPTVSPFTMTRASERCSKDRSVMVRAPTPWERTITRFSLAAPARATEASVAIRPFQECHVFRPQKDEKGSKPSGCCLLGLIESFHGIHEFKTLVKVEAGLCRREVFLSKAPFTTELNLDTGVSCHLGHISVTRCIALRTHRNMRCRHSIACFLPLAASTSPEPRILRSLFLQA